MIYSFKPEAAQEFEDAALYYETERMGLGESFREEIDRLIVEIIANPTRWPTVAKGI